jgi:D-alanyl-D-alanine endopeptidase (penicillin-binding protein 7)
MKRALTGGLGVLVLALCALAPVASEAATASQARKPVARVAKAARQVAPAPKATRVAKRTVVARRMAAPAVVTESNDDPPHLRSAVAFVIDQDTDEVLFSKNAQSVQPIASITKLMTALVVMDAAQRLEEVLTISEEDIDTEKGSHSRLSVGTQLTRGEMLHLALMSSENRAAHALGRHYPGGLAAFVDAMNVRAASLGMIDTHYDEPTGLSSRNRSSARDLVLLVKEAHQQPLLRELSTSHEAQVQVGSRALQYRNTNGLVRNPQWEIGLQKTGYIAEAGRCLVMQAQLAGRKLIMVLLDSAGKYTRIGDAERIRRWLSQQSAAQASASGPRS